MQLLPAIDILEGKAVRLAKGDYNAVTVYNDSPIDQAKAFEEMGAEWIHVVDLDGARSGNPSNLPSSRTSSRKRCSRSRWEAASVPWTPSNASGMPA